MCAILWITGISKIFCIKYQHKKASLPSVNLLKRHLPASDPIFPSSASHVEVLHIIVEAIKSHSIKVCGKHV